MLATAMWTSVRQYKAKFSHAFLYCSGLVDTEMSHMILPAIGVMGQAPGQKFQLETRHKVGNEEFGVGDASTSKQLF